MYNTGNSRRSQMNEGYLRYFEKQITGVYSTSVETHGLSSKATAMVKKDTIGSSRYTLHHHEEYLNKFFDNILTTFNYSKEYCSLYQERLPICIISFLVYSKFKETRMKFMKLLQKLEIRLKHSAKISLKMLI